MRILIENSNYFLRTDNLGDQALFRATIARLLALWPGARLDWITQNPGLMRHLSPDIQPHRLWWLHDWALTPDDGPRSSARLRRRLLGVAAAPLRMIDRPRLRGVAGQADLALATGGGWFSDAFASHACGLLDTLRAVHERGRPAVIMGAGFEPVRDPALVARARAVLPTLDLIACREPRTSPAILSEFGVPPERVLMMGDPALEIAYARRAPALGDGIGVNLRVAPYSETGQDVIAALRDRLQAASARFGAPLRPIPISLQRPRDMDTIAALIGGPKAPEPPSSLDGLLGAVGGCRVVVTGSYHAAVFALAQGIPAVTLARALHYNAKLGGLQAQFGPEGCAVLSLDDPSWPIQLDAAIAAAWESAHALRPGLLATAQSLIADADRAYARLGEIGRRG